MKLLVRDPDRLVFHLSAKDRNTIRALLRRAGEVGRNPSPITRGPLNAIPRDSQEILDAERLAEWTRFHTEVSTWLDDPQRCVAGKGGFGLTLSDSDAEILLQALNSAKVGFWEALGSPDLENGDALVPTPDNISHLFAIERASHYVATLVLALQGSQPND